MPRLRVEEGEAAVLGLRGARHQQAAQLRGASGGAPAAAVAAERVAAAIETLTRSTVCSSTRSATAVAGCTRCPLAQTRTQVVFGSGSPSADLMFVGEAPGLPRGQAGRPVRRRRRPAARQAPRGIGLSRDEVYVANVLKCRPPGNRDPQPEEIAACESHLFRQIELIGPRVVATLGNFATKLLSGKPDGITRSTAVPSRSCSAART